MEKFKICSMNVNNYSILIISESYETPFDYLEELESYLTLQYVKDVRILFDMLLSMGDTTERFAEAVFDGRNFIDNTFQYVTIDKKDTIRKISCEEIRKKPNQLEYSILTNFQKQMIINGIAI